MKKKLLLILGLFVLGFAGFMSLLYMKQEKLLFANHRLPVDHPTSWKEPCEESFLKVDDKHSIHALYFHTENPKGVVLYLHGKGANLSHGWAARAKDFTSKGYNVLLFDYRGFGKSQGDITEKTLLEDSVAAYKHLMETHLESDIFIYGRSLGTGPAIYLGTQFNPKAIILESPYLSIQDMAIRSYPYVPEILITSLLKYPIRADLWIENVRCPIHAFHGTKDEVIPYEASLELYHQNKDRINIQMTTIHDAGHDLYRLDEYQAKLEEVLQ